MKLTPEQKLNNIITEVNSELYDVIEPIREMEDDYNTDKATKDKYQVCENVAHQPVYSKEDIAAASVEVDNILREIKGNPSEFPDLRDITSDFNAPGSGSGGSSIMIPMNAPIYPTWLKEISVAAKIFMKWGRTKNYYDEESLTRGVPRRHTVKKNVREKSIYIILDVSGSMWGYEYRGVPLVQLMVQYLPDLAKRYSGELWQVDTGVNKIVPLKDLTKSKLRELMIIGQGGTDFNEAFRLLADKKKKIQSQGKDADFMTIIFTDGEVGWPEDNSELSLDHLLIVVPKDKAKYVPAPNKEKDRKVILIEND